MTGNEVPENVRRILREKYPPAWVRSLNEFCSKFAEAMGSVADVLRAAGWQPPKTCRLCGHPEAHHPGCPLLSEEV